MSLATGIAPPSRAADRSRASGPAVDVAVPVYNEERVLADSVRRLVSYLEVDFPLSWRVTIVDNASTDRTWAVARELADGDPRVEVLHLETKGRGRALRRAWTASDAAVVAYMDVDLSTDLRALLPLVSALLSGHSDVAIGSRLATGAHVERGAKREVISRTYNGLLQLTFGNGFRDAQCGFKAVRRDVADALLPQVADNGWFFDTELLLLAEHNGLRVLELPVDWTDDPDSRVDIVRTALADLRGMARVARRFWRGEGSLARVDGDSTGGHGATGLVRFGAVGAVSTAASVLLFTALREPLGASAAVTAALTVSAAAAMPVHRRLIFGRRDRAGRRRQWRRAAAVHLLSVALALGAVGLADSLAHARDDWQIALLVVACAMGTGLRLLLLPGWVFRRRR